VVDADGGFALGEEGEGGFKHRHETGGPDTYRT
jgi:hypothetical protein